MKYIILFFSIIITITFSCTPKECQIAEHDLVIPVTLTPAKDTFLIGDTIHIISVFSDEVFDKKTDEIFLLENFKFFPRLILNEISDSSLINETGLLDFDTIIDTAFNFSPYKYSDGAVSLKGEYSYEKDVYSLEYKLIPQKEGFYYFSHFSLITLGEDQDFPGKCSNAGIKVYVQTNEGDSNNIDMLSDSPNPHYNEWMLAKPDERFHKFGGYCFYVKE